MFNLTNYMIWPLINLNHTSNSAEKLPTKDNLKPLSLHENGMKSIMTKSSFRKIFFLFGGGKLCNSEIVFC